MTCTRERKERFILSFPTQTHGWPANARRHLSMYSDAGIDMLVADLIAGERLRIKINNENRAITRQSEQRSAAA